MPRRSTTDAIFIPKKTIWYRGEILRCTGESNVPEKYVKLIQDIALRLRNQGARVARSESYIFNVDVGLHQRSALNQTLFLMLMDVMTDGVSK